MELEMERPGTPEKLITASENAAVKTLPLASRECVLISKAFKNNTEIRRRASLQSSIRLSLSDVAHCNYISDSKRTKFFKQSGSPYHTILPVDSKINQSWGAAVYKQYRSNSWSDSLDECRTGFELNRTILGDSQRYLYDNFKRAYAELLYRWGLLVNRAKVLKYLSSSSDTFRGVEFVTECSQCAKVTQAPMCRDCHKPLLHCTLCRLPVRGSANSCLFCGHGGHLLHMKQWFEKNEVCASGCGCFCLMESSKLVEF